ncbi:MAG: methyltransferase family protein [Phycisphaerae bacterium]
MPERNGRTDQPPATQDLSTFLDSVPVGVRYVFYTVFFLSFLLIALPWLAYQIDVYVPSLHVEIGRPGRMIGIVIFVVFLIVYLLSSRLLTSRGRGGDVEFDPPKEFVACGIYRWVRNPIAASAVLMLLGESLAFSSTGILLLFLLAMIVAHLQVTLLEEPLLRKRFGTSYTAYLAKVPRWLPRRPRGSD